jgi:glycosyltransferase involved in cell wall biosynthesis
MPKVSVIIPTYNRAQMVCRAIDSVLAQTLQDAEIIVVDDGSTDGTGKILADRYGDRIRCSWQENQGRAVARNRGVQAAGGEYVLFLDSDDLLLPQSLELLLGFLDTRPEVDVVYSDGYYCDTQGRDIQRISAERPAIDHDDLLETMVITNVVVACHSAMVRRRCLEALGYPYFDENLRGTEDADLWLRLAAQGSRFAYLDALTCKYRVHDGNESSFRSPNFARRQRCLRCQQHKIMKASYFPTLSTRVKAAFFYKLLLYYLRGDLDAQEEALGARNFESLPAQVRASLLYYVSIDNMVNDGAVERGRRRLEKALSLVPRSLRYRIAWILAGLGRRPLSLIIRLRRAMGTALRRQTGPALSPIDPRYRYAQLR